MLLWIRQDNCETTVEGVRVLIGDSFLTVPISPKDAERKKGETGSIEEVDKTAGVATYLNTAKDGNK